MYILTLYYGDIYMMRNDVYIIKFLLEQDNNINISAIAKGLKIDYKNAYNIVKRLQNNKILTTENFANTSIIKILDMSNPLIYEAQYLRREEIKKNKDINQIITYFENNMKTKMSVMLLFGSYAKKTNTKNSDIDLLFIIPEEKYEKSIIQIISMIPLKIHSNIFTEKEFLEMKNSKEKTIISEALKNNIILYNIGQYIELLK
jgi:predicted nucleotidyltransferase